MVVIVLPSKVELRVLAQRDRLGPGVGGGDPAATPAAPAADGRTSRQQDAAAEALTEMFGKIKFELGLDPRLAEAAALRSANEIMGISPRPTWAMRIQRINFGAEYAREYAYSVRPSTR